MRLTSLQQTVLAIGALTIVVVIAAVLAPYIYAEYQFNLHGQAPTVQSKPDVAAVGRWFDEATNEGQRYGYSGP